ncbi:MAG: hypothetical protein K1X53_12230 [Candidatus Sumerlaeaceae bacterium]|nr:hypothetical protein [Candidatus Sumerlaeaceae bacterium]
MRRVISQYNISTLWLAELCRFLPKSWFWPISCLVGYYQYYFHKNKRRRVIDCYRRLVKVLEIDRDPVELAREHYKRQLMCVAANYVYKGMTLQQWTKYADVQGAEYFDEARKLGRGMVLTMLHFGTDLAGWSFFESKNYDLVLMRRVFAKEFRSERHKHFLGLHTKALFAGEQTGLSNPVRQGIRMLKQDQSVIGIAIDGIEGKKFTKFPIFNGKYEIEIRPGALEIARLAKAPIGFGFSAIHNGRVVLRYFPVAVFDGSKPDDEVMQDFLVASLKNFENAVRTYPESVYWSRPLMDAIGMVDKDKGKSDDPME